MEKYRNKYIIKMGIYRRDYGMETSLALSYAAQIMHSCSLADDIDTG